MNNPKDIYGVPMFYGSSKNRHCAIWQSSPRCIYKYLETHFPYYLQYLPENFLNRKTSFEESNKRCKTNESLKEKIYRKRTELGHPT